MARLDGKIIAILATDGFEEVELTKPLQALKDAGATVEVVSLKAGEIQGFNHFDKGERVAVDRTLEQADPAGYDALVLPGGAHNPDTLRAEASVQRFVRAFFEAGKPVGAICHAPWVLIAAGVVSGRTLTSYETIRTDLKNAGATVVDREVVVDRGLVTSRKPDDIPAFVDKLIEEIAEGPHDQQAAAFQASSEQRGAMH